MNELEKLYNVLFEEGLYTKSFQDFQKKYSSDQAYQNKVYDVVSSEGLYTKDKNSFFQKYSPSGGAPVQSLDQLKVDYKEPVKKKVATGSPSAAGSSVSARIPKFEAAKPEIAASESTRVPNVRIPQKEQQPDKIDEKLTQIQESDFDKKVEAQKVSTPLSYSNIFAKTIADLPSDLGETWSVASAFIERQLGKAGFPGANKDLKASDIYFYQLSDDWRNFTDEVYPTNKEDRNTFIGGVAAGLGQVVPMMVTGGVSMASKGKFALDLAKNALNTGTKLTPFIKLGKDIAKQAASPSGLIGGSQSASSYYRDAIESGATEDQAQQFALENFFVGTVVESLPIQSMFSRISKIEPTADILRILKEGVVGGAEETVTEMWQTTYENLSAQRIYDLNSEMLDGVGEAGAVGGTVGFILNSALAALTGRRARVKNDEEKKIIDKSISEVQSKINTVNKNNENISAIADELESIEPIVLKYGDSDFTFLKDKTGKMEFAAEPMTEEQAVEVANFFSKTYKSVNFLVDEIESSDPYSPTQYKIVAIEKEAPVTVEYKIDGAKMDRARFVAAVEEASNEEALNELETTDPEVQKIINTKRAEITGQPVVETDIVTDEVYNDFVDKNVVPDDVLNTIADKVISRTDLSEKETAIFNGKTSEINEIIKDKASGVQETTTATQPVTINVADKYTTDEVNRVKTLPIENEDGATMNLDGTKYEKGGLVIPLASRNLPLEELTPEKINEFVKENSESIGSDLVKVGIYKFPNSDQASIDINIVADRSKREEALAIARELGQESIFDLDTFENIKTGADGKNPKVLTPKEFLDIQDRLSRPTQTEVTVTPETSSNYANMTEDDEGNFVFFHVGKKGYDTIKKGTGASPVTSREEASALSKVGGLAMYYTAPEQTERQSADGAKYAVKVPKEKVYDFNTDKLNLIDEARQRHESENPGKAFDTNSQIAYVTKIAGEKGFDMVVAEWAGGTRAQTTKELTPVDVQESTGNVIEKNFANQYESNKSKGFSPVVPKRKADKLQAVYDKINEVRSVEKRYDNLYSLYTDSSKYTQEQITDLIEKSDLPQDIKNEYKEILGSKEETRRSEQKKAAPKNIEESIKNSAKTLQTSFPGVNIIVAENTKDAKKQIVDQLTPVVGEENAKTIADQIETARGQAVFYKGKPVAVVVNKEKAISNTAAHEVWHLILREAFGKDAKKFKSFQNAIARELKNAGYTDVADYLDRFSAEYEGDAVYEEYLAELGGLLTTKGFDPKNLTAQEKSILEKIKEIINKFAKSMVGQDVFLKDAKPENILDFMISVSDLVARGEDVREAIGGKKVSNEVGKEKIDIAQQSIEAFSGKLEEMGISIGVVNPKTGKTKVTNFDVAKGLNEYYTKKYGKIAPGDFSQKAVDALADYASVEMLFAMSKFGDKSGKGWYTEDYSKALDILSSIDPDINKDPKIKAITTAIIAVASNSSGVYDNLTRVIYGISEYKKTGKIPLNVGTGKGQEAIATGIDRYNKVVEKLGNDPVRVEKFMSQIDKVSELKKKLVKEFDMKSWADAKKELATDPDWNDSETLPMSVLIFGPKIGAFWSNLSGLDGTPTIDRWCIRTIYRYKGDMRAKIPSSDMKSFMNENGINGASESDAMSLAQEHSKMFKRILAGKGEYASLPKSERNELLKPYRKGDQIWTKAQGVVNDISEGIDESIENKAKYGRDFRSFTKNVFEKARDIVFDKTGVKLSVSDVQAILWIYEKNLFGQLGVKQREDSTYSSAANSITNKVKEGRLTVEMLKNGDLKALDSEKISDDGPMGDIYTFGDKQFKSGLDSREKRSKESIEIAKQIEKEEEITPEYLDVLKATNQTLEDVEIWKEKNRTNKKQFRIPAVQEAAEKYKKGLINQDEYLDVVRKEQPIKPFKKVPDLPSIIDITNAIDTRKSPTGIIGLTKNIKDGEYISSRLDIPAYERYDTWVVSVHDGEGRSKGKSIGYGQTAVIKNVEFDTLPKSALNIASDPKKSKASFARIYGNWVNEDPEAVHERAKELMNNPEWIQVGMNPFRHSWFYDKADGMPVVTADEVIQVGALVLAKNAKKVLPSDPRFSLTTDEGFEIQFQKQLPSRVNDQITNVISEQKALGKAPVEVAREAAKYLKSTDAYNKLGDRDKAKVLSGVKRLSGMRVKVVSSDEYSSLRDSIKSEARKAATEALFNHKQSLNNLISSVRALAKAKPGKISTFKAGVIISRIANTNLRSPQSVSKTLDYIEEMFDNSNLAMKVSKAKSLVKNAKRNIKSKIGSNPDLFTAAKVLLSIDPTSIPTPFIDNYLEVMEVIGERARTLSIKDAGNLAEKMNVIINAVIKEAEEQAKAAEEAKVKETPKEPKVKETPETSAKKAESLTKQILSEELNTSKVLDPSSSAVARKIASINRQDLLALLSVDKDGIVDYSKLNLLLGIRDNIKAGIVTNEAMNLATTVAQNRNVNSFSKVLPKITGISVLNGVTRTLGEVKGLITRKSGVLESIRSTGSFSIDDVIGNFNDTTIYKITFGKLASAKGKLDASLSDRAAKADAAESLFKNGVGLGPVQFSARTDNDVVKAKYKVQILLLQKEFDSNPDSESVAPAIEFINATLKAINRKESSLTKNDARILREIKTEFGFKIDGNETLNFEKIEESLTANDKKAMKLIEEINSSTAEQALFTSAVIRGSRVGVINNYVHHAVIGTNIIQQAEELVNRLLGRGPGGKPSTKAGTLNERTPGAKAIVFDPVFSSMKGARETLTDFYMTPAIREVTGTLNKIKDNVFDDPNSTEAQRNAVQAMLEAVNEALEITFQNHFGEDSFGEAALKAIQKLGYQSMLASVPRAGAEYLSNLSYAVISDPVTTLESINMTDFAYSTDMLPFLENIGSSESTRLAGNQMLTSKYAEGGFAAGYGRTSKSAASSKVMNYASFIGDMTVGNVYRVNDVTADLIVSTPDKSISKPYYAQYFVNKFNELTGIKLSKSDLRNIANGTSEYLSPKYEDAIATAREDADMAIIRMTGSTNAFNTILKNVPRKTDQPHTAAYRAVNAMMARFYLTEYSTVRSAVIALFKTGQISRGAAVGLLTASVTRMSMYLVAFSVLGYLFDTAISNLLDLEEPEEEDDLFEVAKRSIVGSGVNLLARRTIGNVPFIPISFGIEYLNEEYGEDYGLRDGEYDPYKNSLVFSKISSDDLYTKSPWEIFGRALSGPFAPLFSSAFRAGTLVLRANKEGSKMATKKEPWMSLKIEWHLRLLVMLVLFLSIKILEEL